MKKVITESGFECEIDESVLDDMELVDDLAAMDDGNVISMSRIFSRIFPDKNVKKKAYDTIRVDGKVKVEDAGKLLTEIFRAMGNDGKNS